MAQHVCPWWLAYTFDNPLRRFLHKPEKEFRPYLQEGMTAVDLGCATGYFSIAMAGLVGSSGQVIAVDVQRKMLDILSKRARKAGVADRVRAVLCTPDDITVTDKVDFALAFWMAHETPDQARFLDQVHAILKPAGKLLLAEPKMHVTSDEFALTLSLADEVGFVHAGSPPVGFSHAALLAKEPA